VSTEFTVFKVRCLVVLAPPDDLLLALITPVGAGGVGAGVSDFINAKGLSILLLSFVILLFSVNAVAGAVEDMVSAAAIVGVEFIRLFIDDGVTGSKKNDSRESSGCC
jgi:hypothetical protein